jgi:tetratricopeptide (TPR) repeat protein
MTSPGTLPPPAPRIFRNDPCPCGSGKRYKNCHGALASPVAAPSEPVRRLLEGALAEQRAGRLTAAERLYREALALEPANADAMHMLGVVCMDRQRYREALELLLQVAGASRWEVRDVRHNLGLALARVLAPEANLRQGALLAQWIAWDRAPVSPPTDALVSIVVAGRDPAAFTRSLASLNAQTWRKLELIVVDTDTTAACATALATALAACPFAHRRIHRPGLEREPAFNAGVAGAQGRYVALLEAGHMFAPTRVERMLAAVGAGDDGWAFSGVEFADADDRTLDAAEPVVAYYQLGMRHFVGKTTTSFAFAEFDPAWSASNLLLTRALFTELGGFQTPPPDRTADFCQRAAMLSEPRFVAQPLLRLRLAAGEAGAEASHARQEHAQRALEHFLRSLEADPLVRNPLAPAHPANRVLLYKIASEDGHGASLPVQRLQALAETALRVPEPGGAKPRGSAGVAHPSPPEASLRRRVLLVLGMHRSGTSAVARVLNLCGAYIPERQRPAKLNANAKGFFEAEEFVLLNERLLRAAGGSWLDVDFDLERRSDLYADFAADVARLLAAECGTHELVVIKDPRICVLVPWWDRALREAGCEPLYVLPVRNPLEVANSLHARDDMSQADGLALWLRYTARAEAATRGCRRVFLSYPQLLADWKRGAQRVAAAFGLALDTTSRAADVDAFLEADLQHQRASDEALFALVPDPVVDEVKALYRRVLERCSVPVAEDMAAPAAMVGSWPAAPKHQSGVRPGHGDATFVLCIENNAIRPQALLLCESIRTFGGRHGNARIVAVAPRPGLGVDAETQAMLRDLAVDYVDEPLNLSCQEYGSANRVFAAGWAERQVASEFVVVLDSDTVFLGEPELPDDADFAARPVDTKGSATCGPGDPFEAYWRALAELGGVPLDRLPFLTTTISGDRVRASYNGGLVVARRALGIMAQWAALFEASIRANLTPHGDGSHNVFASTGFVGPAAARWWGSNQAALALAAWSRTSRIALYDARYNVPLHMLVEQRPLDPVWRHPRPVHVHYHWLFFDRWAPTALATLAELGVADDRVAWLRARLPFPLPAAEATPDVQREPVIASGPAEPGSGQAAVPR